MYDLFIDNEIFGIGLSPGELNQWLIELNDELDNEKSRVFMRGLGCVNEDFEDFLYSSNIDTPIEIEFGNQVVKITEW